MYPRARPRATVSMFASQEVNGMPGPHPKALLIEAPEPAVPRTDSWWAIATSALGSTPWASPDATKAWPRPTSGDEGTFARIHSSSAAASEASAPRPPPVPAAAMMTRSGIATSSATIPARPATPTASGGSDPVRAPTALSRPGPHPARVAVDALCPRPEHRRVARAAAPGRRAPRPPGAHPVARRSPGRPTPRTAAPPPP